MNTTISPSDLLRRRILRTHGSILFLLTIVNTIVTLVGWSAGKGPFALWQVQQFAAVGLFQAYLLMFVVGVVLWIGSMENNDLRKWNLIGALAHLPPLAANFIFAGLFASYNFQMVSVGSIIVHIVFISFELFAITYRGQNKPQFAS